MLVGVADSLSSHVYIVSGNLRFTTVDKSLVFPSRFGEANAKEVHIMQFMILFIQMSK